MQEELISFETAKLTKEKGFNVPVINSFNYNELQEALKLIPNK